MKGESVLFYDEKIFAWRNTSGKAVEELSTGLAQSLILKGGILWRA